MGITADPKHPGVKHGPPDEVPVPQNETYLVLSPSERAKGFVRPVRCTYVHVGLIPKHPLRDLTPEEKERYVHVGYVKFEMYPSTGNPTDCSGRYWTQAELDRKGCGGATTMGLALAETYARDPGFYGQTYCVHCQMHRPVKEFVWDDGSTVGS